MGRDKVLGLSMAILLIGFAGAFCFRNEPIVESGLKLARAKLLDDGIAQRPGPKPYVADTKFDADSKFDNEQAAKPTVTLQGIEAIEPAETPRDIQITDRNSPSSSSISTEPKSQQEIVSTEPPASQSSADPTTEYDRSQLDQKPSDPPVNERPVSNHLVSSEQRHAATKPLKKADEPVELSIRPNSPAFNSPDSLLEESMSGRSPSAHDGCPAVGRSEIERPESPSSTEYHVRRGDTLTRIAQHMLGDAGRYREIFDANRDQLPSLNTRLKVGMVLQIPADMQRSKRAEDTTAAKSSGAHSNSSTAKTARSRQVTGRAVARTRVLTKEVPNKDDEKSSMTPDDDSQPAATGSRFVPVRSAPFLRSQGADASGTRPRDLSQRPPADKDKSRAETSETETKSGQSSRDDSSASKPSKSDDGGLMPFDANDGT